MKKDSVETYQRIAIKRGGKCLSERYVNSRSSLIFECHKGHIWDTNTI